MKCNPCILLDCPSLLGRVKRFEPTPAAIQKHFKVITKSSLIQVTTKNQNVFKIHFFLPLLELRSKKSLSVSFKLLQQQLSQLLIVGLNVIQSAFVVFVFR